MITLGVANVARAAGFYEQGLGFPRMDAPPEVAFFTLNGSWLGLYGREALANDAGIPAPASSSGAFTLAHNVESEPEVERLVGEAVAAGATLLKAPYRLEWGGYCGYFSDLDGHVWEIAYNPAFWVGPE